MDDPSDDSSQTAHRATAAGAGALIGLAIGGPAGAIVGAASGPVLEPFMARVWNEVRNDGRERAGVVIETAANSLDDVSDFEGRLQATEQTRLLAATAMDAGTRTSWHPKLRALGRSLAAGLADDGARIDEQQLVIGALSDLEVPHAKVLSLLITKKWEYSFRADPPHEQYWRAAGLAERERPPDRYPEWAVEHIGSALPNLAGIVPTLLGTLHRHGLVAPRYDLSEALNSLMTENGDGTLELNTLGLLAEPTITWSATDLGLKLHMLLREAADKNP